MVMVTGHQGGRPLNTAIVVEISHLLDRPSLHVSSKVQPAQKRGRGVDIPFTEVVAMEVGAMENDLNGGIASEVAATRGLGPNPVMTSFKDKLLSAIGTRREIQREERVTGLQATGSRFGILGDDVVTEDEGMVSTEEGVCTGSGVVKDIASTNDTNVTLGAKHSSPLRRAGGIGKACTAP
ncbi:hypothetical protein V6N13_004941 [Hibiscus sabdariffa]